MMKEFSEAQTSAEMALKLTQDPEVIEELGHFIEEIKRKVPDEVSDSDEDSSEEEEIEEEIQQDNSFSQVYSGHCNIRTVKEGNEILNFLTCSEFFWFLWRVCNVWE
jgi:hypothetical protein